MQGARISLLVCLACEVEVLRLFYALRQCQNRKIVLPEGLSDAPALHIDRLCLVIHSDSDYTFRFPDGIVGFILPSTSFPSG